MLRKYLMIAGYVKNMGLLWILYRLWYEFKKKYFLGRINKSINKKTSSIDFGTYRFPELEFINKQFKGPNKYVEYANEAMKGNIFAFSNQYFNYADKNGKIKWNLNPLSGKEIPTDREWHLIPDFSDAGDIKNIWELSRFPQVYYFISAYSLTKDKKYILAFEQQLVSWCNENPFPYGPNYKCGQEITFRIISWLVGISFFYEHISESTKNIVLKNIFQSLFRIESNIDYAVKSVKNNHSISEAAGLFIGGMLFPYFKRSKIWQRKGLKYLLKETSYQIYSDGSYIQHSFNYSRLSMDVLSFLLLIAKTNKIEIPEILYERHKKLAVFLNSFRQKNGYLPNYGANDGAYLFPVFSGNYRDYTPSLNLAFSLHNIKNISEDGLEICNLFNNATGANTIETSQKFDTGGYYILKNEDTFIFIRCHSYKHRPGHNDMLHVDIWHKGINLFCDSGSYSYNTSSKLKDYFIGILAHNTVAVDNENPMQKVLNFGSINWYKSKLIQHTETMFEGEHYGYMKKYGITHKRKVEMLDNKITITDSISGNKSEHKISQIWNTGKKVEQKGNNTIEGESFSISSNVPVTIEKAYISEYYNSYSEGNKIVFSTNTETVIRTEIKL